MRASAVASRRLAAASRHALAAAMLALAGAAFAQSSGAPPGPPAGLTPEQAEQLVRSERFRALASELRCLVCQNQTLADSNAELAIDLRNEVLRQMASGKDDRQIKAHLVERYGEFVLYRPTFSARNLALWAGPAVLLAIGATVLWRTSSRRRAAGAAGASGTSTASTPEMADIDARLARVDRLLDDDAASPR